MADPILFALSIGALGPAQLRVQSFQAREVMSRLYVFDLVLLSALPQAAFEAATLGRRALFVARVGARTRTASGMIASVEHHGVRHQDGQGLIQHSVKLVPWAHRLKRKRGSRIFQGKTFQEVIEQVAAEGQVETRFNLADKPPKRDYLTQYEETDEAFIRRLAAENGLLSYFEQPVGAGDALLAAAETAGALGSVLGALDLTTLLETVGAPSAAETWVFTDRAEYLPIGDDVGDAEPTVAVRTGGALSMQDESIGEMTLSRSQDPATAIYRAFDPDRPASPFEAGSDPDGPMPMIGEGGIVGRPPSTTSATPEQALSAMLEPRDLVFYDHDPRDLFLDWDSAKKEPGRILTQLHRRRNLARGKGSVVRFAPGHRFKLDSHELEELNQSYVVVRVEHRGYAGRGEGQGEQITYANVFECVPADVRYAPKRPKRRCVQAVLTAIVVGPLGEEIHVDDQGRIKVRFHWDRSGERHASSCWIRCMQPWAGAGWGFQFIPRVGMEVVVGFEGGDPDKPIVLGTVYNKILPVPFKLPEQKTLSGLRTKSTPAADGFNELTFEDAVGKERVFVRAQRDLDFEVTHDRAAMIGNQDKLDVIGTRHVKVHRDLVYEVKGGRDTTIEGGDRVEVRGGLSTVVAGESVDKVIGIKRTEVVGEEHRSIEGPSETVAKGDMVTDVRGNAALIVGRHDDKRSLSALVEGIVDVTGSGSIHIRSDTEIILHVKDSFLRISEAGVELGGATIAMHAEDTRMSLSEGVTKVRTKTAFQVVSDDEIKLKTEGASLGLTKAEANLAAPQINLGKPTVAIDEESIVPPEPAKIELVDQDGKPVPNQRFIIDLEGGEQVTGFLDDKGKATVYLDAPGDLSFPDLVEVDG